MSLIKPLFIVLIILLSPQAWSQPKAHIVHYGLSDGLPQRTVMDILQDQKGFMWFATWGGLCKFDGYTFTAYKTTADGVEFVNNNRIDKIKEDPYGKIWTYTAYTKEVYRFDPKTEQYVTSFYIEKSKFQATDIQIMPSGKVWLISNTMGAICVSDTTNQYHVFTQANNKLNSNHVNSIFEDTQSVSWILTDDGIVRVKSVDEEAYAELFLQSDETKNAFFTSHETDQEIWFGANKGRIFCLNKLSGRFETFDLGVGSEIIDIQKIYDDLLIVLTARDGFVILNSDKSSINRFDKSRLEGLTTNEMRSCFVDSKKSVWIETSGFEVAKFDLINNQLKYYASGVSTQGDHISSPSFSIVEDKSGRVWIHPRGGGFSYYDRVADRLMPFFNDPLLPNWLFSHILHALYMDKQGNLWISTRSEGIEKITFDDETFKKSDFTGGSSALNFEIRSFMEDSQHNLWLGSKEGYIVIYDEKKRLKGYLSVDGKISQTEQPLKLMAYTMMQDSNNNIWIGSKGNGLFLLKANKATNSYSIKTYTHNAADAYSLSDDRIYTIHEDRDGNIWIGTLGGGLNLFDETNEQFLNYANQFNTYPMDLGHEVRAINSRDKVIYLATTLGLISFTYSKEDHGISYKIYSNSKNDLRANDIYSVYRTKSNDIYITTHGGGLSVVKAYDPDGFPTKFKTYDTSNKLTSDFILSIIEDDNGKLWIVSEGSLFIYDPKTEQIEQFNDVGRILGNNFFSEATPLLTHQGELLVGCTQGTLSFTPNQIKVNNDTPYLSFGQFRVSGKAYISKGELECTQKVILSHNQNNFTIEYAALDYVNPQGILYAYKLEGLDDDWSYNQKQRLVNYTNLPHGKYLFRVKSTNGNGVWTNNERTLQIEVKPSFWQTKWAWLIYIVLFAFTLFTVLRSIFAFYRMRDKMRLEQEQTEMRTRFFTDISHEIRTPLTLIVSPIEDLIARERVLPDAKPQLQLVLKNIHRMLSMVNQVLDFRKIQQQNLQIREVAFGYFIAELCQSFIAPTEGKNISLIVNNRIASDKIWIDPDHVEQLLFNLVSNAIKHTASGKRIEVNIFKKEEAYALQIKDEGEGVSKEIQSKLFTRFVSFNTDKSKPSTGIGLSIVKEITDKHHAKITVDSSINQGTTFTILFQAGVAHFANDPNVEITTAATYDQRDNTQLPLATAQNEIAAIRDERLSVLIVEDDDDLRGFISTVLSPYYEVYEATNGREGYEMAIKQIPDFILSDIMMPEMTGIELVRTIRSNIETSHIPFIFLTAKTSIDDELEGVLSGANDYITKPFNVKLLRAKIENILTLRKRLSNQIVNEADSKIILAEDKIEMGESFITAYDEAFLKLITDLIDANIDNSELTIDDLVAETNISRKVFYNKVKSLTGLAPVEFVRDIRIKRAAHLLLSDKYMIKEVAYMVGFLDIKYFSRCFKQVYGVVPSAYRKRGGTPLRVANDNASHDDPSDKQ